MIYIKRGADRRTRRGKGSSSASGLFEGVTIIRRGGCTRVRKGKIRPPDRGGKKVDCRANREIHTAAIGYIVRKGNANIPETKKEKKELRAGSTLGGSARLNPKKKGK